MQISKAIYRLKKLAQLMDAEGCDDDVEALNDAIEFMQEKLKEEQINIASQHVIRPEPGRSVGRRFMNKYTT